MIIVISKIITIIKKVIKRSKVSLNFFEKNEKQMLERFRIESIQVSNEINFCWHVLGKKQKKN